MGKYSTPRVPLQTAMFDERGLLTRTWIIFFERLGLRSELLEQLEELADELAEELAAAGGVSHVIGWDIQDATVGTDVSDPVIPIARGAVTRCLIRVKQDDDANDLEIDIKNNGVSIFDTTPVIAAGTATRDVHEFATKDDVTIAVNDDVTIDIVQGGDWEFAAYLPYETGDVTVIPSLLAVSAETQAVTVTTA